MKTGFTNIKSSQNKNSTKKGVGVYVGMSGGVDSSLSAALLKEQGYDVTGVFIRVWSPDFLPRQNGGQACDWKEERRDAMKVAAELDIPFKTYDFQDEYKKDVVDYMIREYKSGRTPNPDVMCNRYVKFGAFLNKAVEEGADFVATGHYARKKEIQDSGFKIQGYQLLQGVDSNKDQSYFLWTLKQEQLEKILFPIGDLEKSIVREEAKRFNLHNAGKKDSQGICFLGKINTKEFLKNYIKPQKGNVLNEEGETIGFHDGAFYFTMGERHGFNVTQKTPTDKPYYVVEKDIDRNTITVSNQNKKETFSSSQKEVEIEEVNWISGYLGVSPLSKNHLGVKPLSGFSSNKKYQARLRYRQNLRDCKIKLPANSHELADKDDERKVVIVFDELQGNVTPGQSLVIYDGEVCLGGGVIA